MLIQEQGGNDMADIIFKMGSMSSGKTTALLQIAYNYEQAGKKIIVIKPAIDKKGDKSIVSRLGISREVDIMLLKDETIKDNVDFNNIDYIFVDEVQFLTEDQIKELWIISKLEDIPVICYGLKTNFKGELFEGSKALIELADKLEELQTICPLCGRDAKFNARMINNEFTLRGDEVAIDGIDAEYKSLCGNCYIEKVLKLKR